MELSLEEFRYSEIIVFGIHNNFNYDSETYAICLLRLVSSQFKLHII